MTTWGLIGVCSLGAIVALGVTLWAATWPVRQDPGLHRRGPDPNPANPATPAPDPQERTQVIRVPVAEPWMWTPPTNPGPPARHRPEHLTEHTQRIRPPRPGGPPPEWPPDNRIQ